MILATSFAEVRGWGEGEVGLVPTMGFFHEGHLSLMAAARSECDSVVVSLFVNPLQFGAGEDLADYPRDLDRDAGLAEAEGVDVLFAPPLEEMYPEEPVTRVTVEALAAGLCGPWRPGHFSGVATVVAKLLGGLRPGRAYFGRKDAQQLAIVRRMVRDLSFPVEVVGLPIVREEDGLALSSRNIYLSPEERRASTALWRGLAGAAQALGEGERRGSVLEAIAREEMLGEVLVDLQYAQLVDAGRVSPLERLDRPAFLAVAARVGHTRLIDNLHVWPSGEVDLGVRLEAPSILYQGASR